MTVRLLRYRSNLTLNYRCDLLFLCSQNKRRSLTAEKLFDGQNGHQARSAGTDNNEVEQILDRDTYRRIKKMDRATLEELIQNIFERGRKKGLAEAGVMVDESMADDRGGTLDLRKVESEIRGIKGIGEKKAEEIMLIFEKHLGILSVDMKRK